MKKLLDWCKHHLVASWAIASAVFAIVIHIFFSIPAPFEWLEATWSAGDVLTYTSTIVLGLLAIWQNQKFKEESDKAQLLMDKQNPDAQNRLERISLEANALSTINRIIDHETRYLEKLESLLSDFMDVAGFNYIASFLSSEEISDDTLFNTSNLLQRRYEALRIHFLSAYENDSYLSDLFGTHMANLMNTTNELLVVFTDTRHIDTELLNKVGTADAELILSRVLYIGSRQKLLTRIVLENMSLSDVRSLYHLGGENNEQTKT